MTRKQQESARIPTQRECDALTCDCIKQCKRIYPRTRRAGRGRMTDTPLLRLARALLDGAECRATFDETTDRVRSLVRDLEAAQRENETMREALRDIRDNFDHETYTRQHGPQGYSGNCRCCVAYAALSGQGGR